MHCELVTFFFITYTYPIAYKINWQKPKVKCIHEESEIVLFFEILFDKLSEFQYICQIYETKLKFFTIKKL